MSPSFRAFCRAVCLAMASALALAGDAPDAFARYRPSPSPAAYQFDALLGGSKVVAVVTLEGETNDVNYYSVKRRFREAAEAGAGVILLDIDSPGGPVDSSIRLANLIADQTSPPVVAYVSHWAISGGAMAALATPNIVMHPRSQIGGIQPIMMVPGEGVPVEAPEKFVSPLRSVLQAHAEQNGYPIPLAVAMVDPDVEVIRVWPKEGAPFYVTASQKEELSRSAAWEQVDRHELVVAKGKLLTLTAREAEEHGIARELKGSRSEAAALFLAEGGEMMVFEPTAAEGVVALLNAQWFSSLLILVGLGALYMAVRTPGFGVPETVAIACFVVFFFSKSMVGKADILEVAMFLTGVGLILLELFVIPGFGVVGLTGIVMVVASLVLALQDFAFPRYAFQWEAAFANLGTVVGSMLAALLLIVASARYLPSAPLLRRLVLSAAQTEDAGYGVEETEHHVLVGKEGIAITTLRPSGRAEIEGDVFQVVTQGEMIEKDEPVRVVEATGNRITVVRA